MIKDEPAGQDVDVNKDKPAGLDENMIKDEPAGLDEDLIKDKPAGLDGNVNEDEPTGLDDKPHSEAVRRIKGGGRRATRWVKVKMGGEELDLYCNTGSSITIITPAMYRKSMGKVVAAKSYLRARGSND